MTASAPRRARPATAIAASIQNWVGYSRMRVSEARKVQDPSAKNREWNSAKNCCQPSTAATASATSSATVNHEPKNRAPEAAPGAFARRYRHETRPSNARTATTASAACSTIFTSVMCATSEPRNSGAPSASCSPPRNPAGAQFMT